MGSTALTAEVFPGNAASVAVLERNGFRLARRAKDAPAATCGAAALPGSVDGRTAHPDPQRPRDQFLMLAADRPPGRPEPRVVRFLR
jgi:RimJ/RimL family protein N-acetyltransferase